MSGDRRLGAVRVLRRERPRSRLLRATVLVLAVLVALSWASGEIDVSELFRARRLENLRRFVQRDALPVALRGERPDVGEALRWARGVWNERAAEATWATLWIAVLSTALAALAASVAGLLGARTVMGADPFRLPAGGAAWAGGVSATVRLVCVALRAIPEYVWAFLLLAILGPSAWAAVLALAIHNAGILGRLGAETVENLDRAPLRALSMLGASRRGLALGAVFPLALPRFLLYVFYRFETCVREATVLGMLGVVSLGYWIQEARGRQRYDEMLLLVACGALLVLLADVVSLVARAWIRDAGRAAGNGATRTGD